jgi:hypothetical protein
LGLQFVCRFVILIFVASDADDGMEDDCLMDIKKSLQSVEQM